MRLNGSFENTVCQFTILTQVPRGIVSGKHEEYVVEHGGEVMYVFSSRKKSKKKKPGAIPSEGTNPPRMPRSKNIAPRYPK